MKRNYLLVKNKSNKEIAYIDYNYISGFKFSPLNTVEDSISVNQMVIINPTFIERVLTKKTKIKLELYLEYIVKLLDEDDDSDITGLRSALNDITRYKEIVMNKYRVYLDEHYYELFMKKLSLLEYELKMKVLHYKDNAVDNEIKETYEYEEDYKEAESKLKIEIVKKELEKFKKQADEMPEEEKKVR